MTKILIDARLYGLEHAGLGRYVMNLVEELKILGKNEEYVILLRKNYFNQLKFPGNWKRVLYDRRHYSFKEQFELPKILIKEKPDLVHFPHFNVPVFYKGDYVVTIHDMLMHHSKGRRATTLPWHTYWIKRAGYWLIFDSAVKKAIKVVVPSNYVKNEVVKYYKVKPQKVKVTYEGLDSHFARDKANVWDTLGKHNLKKDFFIYVGNAYPHKNVESAIEAISILNNKLKIEADLVISSSRNVFTERLNKVARECGAEKHFKYLGFVPDSELTVLMQKSKGFIK